jgi:hypothetical protein
VDIVWHGLLRPGESAVPHSAHPHARGGDQ